ncbi:sirohydrochlorin chelatase [Pseudacidovorax sp. RU35E]|jgi:sirohydrochlorin cobaltochelatase|uniref:sirohydrochlorin chelatase n=1 Tax=Pseudacidovorax sp. RU35E TaxID=1907403 RepID=UPI0009541569|nr:CbiX/SirB N-terminal domain-containing protein [Pseudacidovorax sp. RU35E]SIR26634.1 sirohydrochlorin cobaltochelatase [Pseudacidovorax sp. RU35E]
MTTRGIVLFAHGSRDAQWREPVEAVARRVSEQAPDARVRCAYLEMVSPDLPAAVAELVAEGVESVHVVPLFLGMGRHAREDLPLLMAELRQQHPGVHFTKALTVGQEPAVIDLLARLAVQPPR